MEKFTRVGQDQSRWGCSSFEATVWVRDGGRSDLHIGDREETLSWKEKNKYIKYKKEIVAKLSGKTDCIQVLAEGLALVERNSYFNSKKELRDDVCSYVCLILRISHLMVFYFLNMRMPSSQSEFN